MIFPKTIVSSGFPAVRQRCLEMGIVFDAWQEGVGTLALGKRADGKYAATVGGVVLSIPRQVGKTFLVAALVMALCTLHPGLTVVWTAHRTRTATRTFQSLQAMAKRKRIAPFVKAIRTANGEQEIRFHNTSAIMFGAREQGFGRGFDSVDIEVFDEAQILTEKALEDMVPATNASKQPTGALLFFMGTPPRPIDPGEEFTNRRQRALGDEWVDGVYIEFSADPDASPDDLEQIAKANPSFPDRTPLESIQRMRQNLTDDESFLREAMGVWDVRGGDNVIDPDAWNACGDATSLAVDKVTVAVDVSPDRSEAAVAIAGQRADGLWHVELAESRAGTAWLVPWVADLVSRNRLHAVVIDGGSPAASLIGDFTAARVRTTMTDARAMAAACGGFFDAVADGSLRHTEQPQLTAALGNARKRTLLGGESWGWSRKNSASDITPVVAATLALWGAKQDNRKTKRPRISDGRGSTGRRGFAG